MAKLTLVDPAIGEKVTASDPKIVNAFVALQEWANGNVGLENLENKGVTLEKLSTAVQTTLAEKTAGGVMKKAVIATEESRESAAFGTLTTPDEVEVVLAENGLIAIWYEASWKASVEATITAGLFLGATQAKLVAATGNLETVESGINVVTAKVANWGLVTTRGNGSTGFEEGLVTTSFAVSYGGGVTTGQLQGSPVIIKANAGTYKISIRFKASTGKVMVKNRTLKALAYA